MSKNSGSTAIGAGAAIGAVGSILGGMDQKSSLDRAADIQDENADQALRTASENANKQQMIASKDIGTIKANYGASGVESTSGSVMDVLGASAANAEIDRLNIIHGGDLRALNYRRQADMDRTAGSRAETAGFIGGGAQAITAGALLL